MSIDIKPEIVAKFNEPLATHPVYAAVATVADLRVFMEHHVYSVWDFMSLIKTLQRVIAPTRVPWVPGGDGDVQRFINELVLEEESDRAASGEGFTSHFELYLAAMREVGADTGGVTEFVDRVGRDGIDAGLALGCVPAPSRRFTTTTFAFIDNGGPHRVAAALALGREHVIPNMFRAILARIGVGEQDAPIFHAYLKRHIHLDEDFHAPLSLRLLNGLCGNDPHRIAEAVGAASEAVQARLLFWDGVLDALRGTPPLQTEPSR